MHGGQITASPIIRYGEGETVIEFAEGVERLVDERTIGEIEPCGTAGRRGYDPVGEKLIVIGVGEAIEHPRGLNRKATVPQIYRCKSESTVRSLRRVVRPIERDSGNVAVCMPVIHFECE